MQISLDDSVSLVFPADNAERWLAAATEWLLSLCAELSRDFEVVIVDNGSVDATSEIARELSRRFPQVRWLRLEWRYPIHAINQIAQRETASRYLLLVDDPRQVGASELRRLWDRRHDSDLALARCHANTIRFDGGGDLVSGSARLLHRPNLRSAARTGTSLRWELGHFDE